MAILNLDIAAAGSANAAIADADRAMRTAMGIDKGPDASEVTHARMMDWGERMRKRKKDEEAALNKGLEGEEAEGANTWKTATSPTLDGSLNVVPSATIDVTGAIADAGILKGGV